MHSLHSAYKMNEKHNNFFFTMRFLFRSLFFLYFLKRSEILFYVSKQVNEPRTYFWTYARTHTEPYFHSIQQ